MPRAPAEPPPQFSRIMRLPVAEAVGRGVENAVDKSGAARVTVGEHG